MTDRRPIWRGSRRTLRSIAWRRSSRPLAGCAAPSLPETTLLGFCGAPWTVASYMIAGKGTPDQAPARLTAYRRSGASWRALIDRLVEASTAYLDRRRSMRAPRRCRSSRASARRCRRPCSSAGRSSRSRRIVTASRRARPRARIIVFVRGGGGASRRLRRGRRRRRARPSTGRLDLAARPAGPAAGRADPGQSRSAGPGGGRRGSRPGRRSRSSTAVRGRPHIFNLGHGIVPETPVEHMSQRRCDRRGVRAEEPAMTDAAISGSRPCTSSR